MGYLNTNSNNKPLGHARLDERHPHMGSPGCFPPSSHPIVGTDSQDHQPSVEDEIEDYWKSQLLSDLSFDQNHGRNNDLQTYISEYDRHYPTMDAVPYSSPGPMTSYAETIYDDSSAKTSLSSSPQIPYMSIPWQDSDENLNFIENWTDFDETYIHNPEQPIPLSNLSKPWPDFEKELLPLSNQRDDKINPRHLLHDEIQTNKPHSSSRQSLQTTTSTPKLRPSSPPREHSPSPSLPLPPPLQPPSSTSYSQSHSQQVPSTFSPSKSSPPSSFQETLSQEILRRHQVDASIKTAPRNNKRKVDALIEENAKRMEWAKDMLLRFPRESSRVFMNGR